MIYMGIDASSKKTGWSIFKDNQLIDYGIIEPIDSNAEFRDRIRSIMPQLGTIVDKYNPDVCYTEDVPLMEKGSKKTLVILGAVQGSIIGLFSSRNIPVEFIGVSNWRSKLGLFTGKKEDTKREQMKKSSIEYANKNFEINLKWVSPSSKKNEDDIADAINVCWSQIKPKSNRGFNKK